jgi:hypothetical protein
MTTLLTHAPVSARPRSYPIAAGLPRRGQPRIVMTEPQRCFAIDGSGQPGGPEFESAMGAIYATAYGLHFLLRDRGIESRVGPSECLWERTDGVHGWAEGQVAFDPGAWRWTLLLHLPAEAADEDIEAALAVARRQQPTAPIDRVRPMTLEEGLVVEALHVGPYVEEPETIARMRLAADAAGLEAHGAHHEIYLGDPRRCLPENLRTVLRQPVRARSGR